MSLSFSAINNALIFFMAIKFEKELEKKELVGMIDFAVKRALTRSGKSGKQNDKRMIVVRLG